MFGFKKKEQKPLWIMGKDVIEIIRSDYDEGMVFTLIEFHYQGGAYLMGSCIVPPDAEDGKADDGRKGQTQNAQYRKDGRIWRPGRLRLLIKAFS